MSQSLNRGEKTATSSAADTVEPGEPAEPDQPTSAETTAEQADAPTSPAEIEDPDDAPTLNLDDGPEEGATEEADGQARGTHQPVEGDIEEDAEEDIEEDTEEDIEEDEEPVASEHSAESSSDDAVEDAAEGYEEEPREGPTQETAQSADEDPSTASSGPSEEAPVATPATMKVVDEGVTPAEALSPYDLAAGSGASTPADSGEHVAWSPESGEMPPSIVPRSPAVASSPGAHSHSEPQQAAVEADPAPLESTEPVASPDSEPAEAAQAGPDGVYIEPVGEAAFPPALSQGTDTKAEKTKKKAGGAPDAPTATRRRRLIPAACAAGAAALLLAWGGVAWWTTQHIASGTSVSGVDVSGLGPREAQDRISKGVGDQLAQPVTLTVGQGSSELVPSGSGVSVDTEASVKQLTGFTLNPLTLAQRLGGRRVDAVIRVDAAALRGALEDRVDTMANGAVSATVTLEGTKPVTTPASNGVGIDVEASVKQLTGSWPLGKQTIAMPEGTAIPAITDEEATKFVDGTLKPLLSSGLTVDSAAGSTQGRAAGSAAAFTPQDTAGMLRISSEGGALSATFDPTALHDAVITRIGQIETPAQNATWKIDGSAAGAPGARPQYVPSAQGNVIDTSALSASLLKAGTTATDVAGRTVALPMVVAEPTVTTPQNEWGISEPIGEYATPYNSGDVPRTQNLTRGAELVNGTVIKPGETFSLEQTLGEVDYEHGFADAGVISNGQHVDSLGGGLSQVATTVFNAGFEAGLDDTEHHAHEYYFDRYPAGREATLWTGKLDVKLTNSASSSVLVQAWLDGEQIHVRMWSTKYYDVSITSSDRSNFRPVSTERKSGPSCEPYSGGNPGFDITVTRTRKHDGKALPDDVLTTQYAADNNIVCS